MKKNIIILQNMRLASVSFSRIRRVLGRSLFHIAIGAGLAAFLSICLSFEVLGAVMALVSLLCIWGDDILADKA